MVGLRHHPTISLALALGLVLAGDVFAQDRQPPSPQLSGAWRQNGLATVKFELQGAASRSNPLRRKLAAPFAGESLFFRYRIRYAAASVDSPAEGDGEFVVFWLDSNEGNDSSTHSGGVPNAGIHVAGGQNRFMVRFAPSSQQFAAKLVGDRDYLVVGRLWKTNVGETKPFDRLDLWVDPEAAEQSQPHAATRSAKSISTVAWVGFSTGVKTELEDRMLVWDIAVAPSWRQILGLPDQPVGQPLVAERTVRFKDHVLPILREHCFECHAGEDAEEGVRLDVWDEVLNRTSPRNATSSRLFQLAASGEMPPGDGRLDEQSLSVLRAWIDEGVEWDERLLPTPTPQTDHWAFQPIRRPAIPEVRQRDRIRTPVDAFILRRQEELGVRMAPEADSATLDRRVSLDLLGLPPHRAGIPRPAEDIAGLLANPAYGERWGRHWLDVARWAESNGHQHNRHRQHAWRYRDWVVAAFNSNKPYDEFVREQIAGDEIRPPAADKIVATGYLAAARYSGNELDKQIQRNDILTDVTNATASAFLGLTLGCAQCHSHKFDPLTIRDYYRFQAFFAKGQPANILLQPDKDGLAAVIQERWSVFNSTRAKLVAAKQRQGIANPIVIPKTVLAAIKGPSRERFDQLESRISAASQSWAWQSATSARPDAVAPHDMRFPLPRDPRSLETVETYLLLRGDVKSPGPRVEPGWPTVFDPSRTSEGQEEPSERNTDQVAPRMRLASWLVDGENPLTARVWVNRIWQWHFGRGLVSTSNDFGVQGAAPTHPELLDYLASELIDSDWNTNHIHLLLLRSATYRQSSQYSKRNAELDSVNQTYWRWTPRRLEAEAIRDCVLAVSGQLNDRRGGPSVVGDEARRSLYLRQRRAGLPHQQQLFDGAVGDLSCARRRVSTTALQPLWMLNSSFMQRAAKRLAERGKSVERVFELALQRRPRADELTVLRDLSAEHGLASVCLVVLNSSEFSYLR